MTQHTHTPGPWTTTGTYVYGPDDEDIAKVSNVKDSGVIAAAPDLLAALQGVLKYYGEVNVRKDYNKVVAHNAAIKAITKATGDTP